MRRIVGDAPGPGQEMAVRVTELAPRVIDNGNFITVRWTPEHKGVEGIERVDRAARDAASLPPLRATRGRFGLSFLRRRATERATRAWRMDIEERNHGQRAFRLPTARSRSGIRPQLRRVTRGVAARFFQLLSSHAMTAPFLRDGWGWTNSDVCLWCSRGRQSREHLFKECKAWTAEIRELWTAVGEASGGREQTNEPFKSRKGFGYKVRQARARPRNTSVRDLLSDDRYTEAVLRFLEGMKVGEVKAGSLFK